MWYMYHNGILFHPKKQIFPLVTTWMHLKGILLSVICQTEKDKSIYHLYVESEKVSWQSWGNVGQRALTCY